MSTLPLTHLSNSVNLWRTPKTPTISNKYALLIGVEYLNTNNELLGCRRDTLRFKQLLVNKLGFKSHQTKLLLEGQATYQGICNNLANCVQQSKLAPTEIVIYFSGHGTGITRQVSKESDNQDESIVPFDFVTKGVLTDNIIWSYLKQLATQSHCLCVWDSCNSGTVADLGYILSGDSLRVDSGGRVCPATIISVSGCQDNQSSSVVKDDTGWNSALTSAVIQTFQQSGFQQTLRELSQRLTKYMSQNDLSQRPVITTSQQLDLTQQLDQLLGLVAPVRFVDPEAERLYQGLVSDPDPTVRLYSAASLLDLSLR